MNANADDRKKYGVYINSMLSKKVVLSIVEIGKNLKYNLEKKIKYSIEGRCIAEGFIRPKTVEVISYSSGTVKDDHVEFYVIYRCLVCNPVKDMKMDCIVNNVTKAGIHAFVKDDDDNTPVTVFVARDHHATDSYFDSVQEKDHIQVRIIGTRYELNDPSITAIAMLVAEKAERRDYEDRRDYEERRDFEERRDYEERRDFEEEPIIAAAPYEVVNNEPRYKDEPIEEHVGVVYDEEALKLAKKRKIVIKK